MTDTTELISATGLTWLFLGVFCVHDLEEIIWLEWWKNKHASMAMTRIPGFIRNKMAGVLNITASQFAAAVLLELVIFIPFTFLAAERHWYFLFLAINAVFFLHVFTHLALSLYLRVYTPGVVTAVILVLPYCSWLFYRLLSADMITWSQLLVSIPVGLLLLPIVLIGHRLGKRLV